MNREDELRKTIKLAQEELYEIMQEHDQKEAAKLVGKCFKYRNCYSFRESENDYWWQYGRVIGAEGGTSIMITFQIDCYGRIEIEPKIPSHPYSGNGWEEIGKGEWTAAVKELQSKIIFLFRAQETDK